MSDDETKVLHTSIAKMKLYCKAIRIVCFVSLIVFISILAVLIGLQIYEHINGSVDEAGIKEIIYQIVFGLLVCFVLIVTLRALSDIVAGNSPFSMAQVRRLRLIGVALVLFALVESFLSIPLFFSTDIAGQFIAVVSENGSVAPIIKVNLTAIIASLACFGLAIICKYGILLQEISDDTV